MRETNGSIFLVPLLVCDHTAKESFLNRKLHNNQFDIFVIDVNYLVPCRHVAIAGESQQQVRLYVAMSVSLFM